MKRRHHRRPAPTYTLMHELTASPTEPLPEPKRRYQLERMYQGLHAMETAADPDVNDWRAVSDAVNFLEALVQLGALDDGQGLLQDAITAMAQAGQRHRAGKPLRLDGVGMQAVRAVLEDYATALEQLPARTVIRAVRITEKRIWDLLDRGRAPAGTKVVIV